MADFEPGPGRTPSESSPPFPTVLTGGVVAHNDERRIERSVRSLLSQELPTGTRWGRIWVVASGCTDRTVEIARRLAEEDSRLGLVVEPARTGKAAALCEVLHRADGDALVLLNSDAEAAPGAVASLLAKAQGKQRPFAVMARPTVLNVPDAEWVGTMRWMWELHHELHREMLAEGRGAHLSDELLLVSLPAVPWIEPGVINDGSYCAVWLQTHAGSCWYAPEARVWIEVPGTPAEHLRQRRRIHVGNAQVRSRLGRPPSTAFRYFLAHPSRTLRAFRRALQRERGVWHLLTVIAWEIAGHVLARWDRVPPKADHVRWSRIESSAPAPALTAIHTTARAAVESATDRRIRVVLDVAGEFGTGVSISRLSALLPNSGVGPHDDISTYLARRPDLAQVVGDKVYPASRFASEDSRRAERGQRFRRSADALVRGPLRWLGPNLRCIGVTGSTAYGEPDEHDDLDFFVVTRAGALSWFLAATYASLRLHSLRTGRPISPPPCFNYVVDERRVLREFAHGRGLLFAREALTAQILDGDSYYRGLLQHAPWMRAELPRLYADRSENAGDTAPRPAPLLVRLLSAVAFLPLAAHLQLAGLRRNAELRHAGRGSGLFRTATEPGRVAFLSRRFEELRDRYEDRPGPTSAIYPGATSPSRIPSSR